MYIYLAISVYLVNKATIFYENVGHATVTPICSNK